MYYPYTVDYGGMKAFGERYICKKGNESRKLLREAIKQDKEAKNLKQKQDALQRMMVWL